MNGLPPAEPGDRFPCPPLLVPSRRWCGRSQSCRARHRCPDSRLVTSRCLFSPLAAASCATCCAVATIRIRRAGRNVRHVVAVHILRITINVSTGFISGFRLLVGHRVGCGIGLGRCIRNAEAGL